MIIFKRQTIAFLRFLSNLEDTSKYFNPCSSANFLASSILTLRSQSHLLPINNPITFSFSFLYNSYQDSMSLNDSWSDISYINNTPSFLLKNFLLMIYIFLDQMSLLKLIYIFYFCI